MSIKKAVLSDLGTVKRISERSISETYPHYYPKGAVEFFLRYHDEKSIADDISRERVFICFEKEQKAVGTVTVKDNEICRLFVLPEYQKYGYGREMLDYAESVILDKYTEVVVDASLPAKSIYQRRGYKAAEFNTIKVGYNDFLCYDVMIK